MPTASTCSSAIAQHRSVYFSGVGTGSYLVPPTKAIAPPTAAFAPDEKRHAMPINKPDASKIRNPRWTQLPKSGVYSACIQFHTKQRSRGNLSPCAKSKQDRWAGGSGSERCKGQAATAKADVWVVLRIGAARNRLKWKDRTFGFGRVFSVSIETLDQREVPICLVRMMDQINV